jgi:primosomal protein N' (replication factor Y) (superfamily II helicase)
VSLVLHGEEGAMRCHYCGYSAKPPTVCPGCGGSRIRFFGAGTERVEQQARELLPEARIARLDSDIAARRGRLEATLDAFARGDIDVLVGTQMIGKGLHVPNVTLVGVIAADTALGFPDFRAAERTFALITQVAGRAGRGDDAGRVIVQTYNPDHYSIEFARTHDYVGFAREELSFRQALGYPPYMALCLLRLSGEDSDLASQAAATAGNVVRRIATQGPGLTVLGPSPSPLYRLQGRYRWNIVIKGASPVLLSAIAHQIIDALQAELPPQVRVSMDVDPQSVL